MQRAVRHLKKEETTEGIVIGGREAPGQELARESRLVHLKSCLPTIITAVDDSVLLFVRSTSTWSNFADPNRERRREI